MKLCEVLQIECLEFYEQVVAFSYLKNKGETLLIASCLGIESDQSAIKLASKMLSVSYEQATALAARVLRDAQISSVSEDIELRSKLQSVVSVYE